MTFLFYKLFSDVSKNKKKILMDKFMNNINVGDTPWSIGDTPSKSVIKFQLNVYSRVEFFLNLLSESVGVNNFIVKSKYRTNPMDGTYNFSIDVVTNNTGFSYQILVHFDITYIETPDQKTLTIVSSIDESAELTYSFVDLFPSYISLSFIDSFFRKPIIKISGGLGHSQLKSIFSLMGYTSSSANYLDFVPIYNNFLAMKNQFEYFNIDELQKIINLCKLVN